MPNLIDGQFGVGARPPKKPPKKSPPKGGGLGAGVLGPVYHAPTAPSAPAPSHSSTPLRDPGARGESHAAAEIASIVRSEQAKPKEPDSIFATAMAQVGKRGGDEEEAKTPEQERKDLSVQEQLALGRGGGQGGYSTGYAQEVQAEARAKREKVDQREAIRDARAKALGLSGGALTSAGEQLKEMTDEQYFKLSDRQRAAVDFNTMLSGAVEKDLNRQGKYATQVTDVQRKTYDTSVQSIFGKEGGSQIFAPETVAVLRQLKIEDKAADLDQYLGLEVAITEKDLRQINDRPPDISALVVKPTDAQTRTSVQGELIDKTSALTEKLAKGNELLQNFNASAAADRRDDVKPGGFLGGLSAKAGQPAPGYGAPTDPSGEMTIDGYFQSAFDSLGDKNYAADRDNTLKLIKNDLYKPGQFQQFLSYVDSRTKNTKFYDQELGSTAKVDYPSADKYREILGLNR